MGRKKRPKLEAPAVPQPQQGFQQPPGTTNPLVCIPVPIEPKIPPASILFGRDDDVEQKRNTQNRSISFDPRVKIDNNITAAAASTANATTGTTTAAPATAPAEKESSSYGMHSHSGDLIEEHIYVSDGSDDEFNFNTGNGDDETNTGDNTEDKNNETKIRGENADGLELLLTGSKMGLMRRGLAAQLYQPKTWIRQQAGNANSNALNPGNNGQNASSAEDGDGNTNDSNKEGGNQLQSEDEKIKQDSTLTPAEKAAQLLATKKQKEEELKQMKRTLESSENAGRDPCLFSKRTAFDIRMDQIEDKPWDRSTGGTADITDFFNYGLSEEDWLEYSDRQLTVRQELTDASRQRRSADPTIVPVVPKTPAKQTPKVAVAVKKEKKETPEEGDKNEDENIVIQGPNIPKEMSTRIKKEVDDDDTKSDNDTVSSKQSNKAVEGGVWGIDVTPGSKLAKLLEEQERNTNKNPGKEALPPPPPPPPLPMHQQNMNMHNDQQGGYHNAHFQQQQKGPPPPPPPSFQDQYFPPQHHAPPGQYHRGNTYGRGQYHQGRGGPHMSQHNQFYHDQGGGRGNHFGGRGNQYGGRGDFGGRGRGRGGRGHWGNGPQQGQQFSGGRGGRGGGRGYMRDDWHRR